MLYFDCYGVTVLLLIVIGKNTLLLLQRLKLRWHRVTGPAADSHIVYIYIYAVIATKTETQNQMALSHMIYTLLLLVLKRLKLKWH